MPKISWHDFETLNLNVATLPGKPSAVGLVNVATLAICRDIRWRHCDNLELCRILKCRCRDIVATLDKDVRSSCG